MAVQIIQNVHLQKKFDKTSNFNIQRSQSITSDFLIIKVTL